MTGERLRLDIGPLGVVPRLVKALRKLFLRTAVLVLLVVVAVIVLVSWELTTVARLDAGHGIQIRVVADTYWHRDPIRAYYYEVHRGFSTVVETTYFGGGDSDVSFELRTTSDRKLVALVESSEPNIVYAMFDIATGETWPRDSGLKEHRQREDTLLARLQQSHRDITFILCDRVSGGASL